MAGEIILSEVAAPSTPSSGRDALYMTNSTPARLARVDSAGTVFPQQEQFIIDLTADYTLTDSATAQKAFNSPTNGQITLPASTSYEFEALYMISNTGTTAHTWSTLFAGTATITALDYSVLAYTGVTSAATLTAVSGAFQATGAGSLPTTALAVTASSTSATEFVQIRLRGTIRINATGTLIPQVKLSAQPNGTEKMLRGSFFRMTPFGSDTTASLGPFT